MASASSTLLRLPSEVQRLGWVPLFGWGEVNPLKWLGDAATQAAGETWTAAMVAAWSSGQWILSLAFRVIDAVTSPDLSAGGPMQEIYPYTFGLGLVVALVMAFAQIGVAAVKRDGASVARLLIGVAQFAAVWVGYVAVAAALVTAAAGLTHGLLHALLGVNGFSGYHPGTSWPRDLTDTTTATVLGICAWLLIWPAAIAYLLIMLVREAALVLLAATSPIAAGGLMSEIGRTWFWRSLRWFLAAILVAPLAALVLGVGERISAGVVSGAGAAGAGSPATTGAGDTAASVGMAVVGCVLVLIGALCPLILFRLLAFVDPGTSSGAAMRTALASHGGLAGVFTGATPGAGAGAAASQSDGAGRSAGESSAETATSSRFARPGSAAGGLAGGVAGGVLAGVAAASRVARGAVNVGSDVLSSSGIGHQHPYYPQYSPDRGQQSRQRVPSTRGFDAPGDPPDDPAPPAPAAGNVGGGPGDPAVGAPSAASGAGEAGSAGAAAAAL